MRLALCVLLAAAAACSSSPGMTECCRTGTGPGLNVTAYTQVVPVPGGAPSLQISAVLTNPSTTHILVGMGPQCPLFVQLLSDPTGQPMGSLDGSMACPSSTVTLDVAPGDSAILTRTLTAAALTQYPSGTYGVDISVTTSTALTGVWAGAVQLPLTN
jgi:hypothetical protein